ncbi:MAG TPA: DUF4162 domain-containing protein, partial [Myxococcota bacterium]|nr:DUF4162 domain-containing protein [Myxococcota bacterium]
AVEFDGDAGWLDIPEIETAEREEDGWHLRLRDDVPPRVIVERALASGIELRRFERVAPRLHEIFIRHAGAEAAAEAGRPTDVRVAEAVR